MFKNREILGSAKFYNSGRSTVVAKCKIFEFLIFLIFCEVHVFFLTVAKLGAILVCYSFISPDYRGYRLICTVCTTETSGVGLVYRSSGTGLV